MTQLEALQQYLKDTGRYRGRVDNIWGTETEDAIIRGLTDGPDTQLTTKDYIDSAMRLHCPVANIMAVASVEAAGAGFEDGKPKILPERHIFHKLTNGRFDAKFPRLSYPKWGTYPYPVGQNARYELLLDLIHLDVDAGFAACSYGKFQILGSNFKSAGYANPRDFAFAHAYDEKTQLQAFERFIEAEGLLPYLQHGIWTNFASRYNGPAYLKNRYDVKLAQAARTFERFSDRKPA